MARGERAEACAGADEGAAADARAAQREVGDAAVAAAQRDRAAAAGTGPAWTTTPAHAARTVSPGGREVGTAVGAGRERRRGRVVEAARHLAWDRPLPSLGSGGGGIGQVRQDGECRRDEEGGRGRGDAHGATVRVGSGRIARMARSRCRLDAESLRSCAWSVRIAPGSTGGRARRRDRPNVGTLAGSRPGPTLGPCSDHNVGSTASRGGSRRSARVATTTSGAPLARRVPDVVASRATSPRPPCRARSPARP